MSQITREHFNRNLSRAEVLDLLGPEVVSLVESENCDYTGRVSSDLDCANEVEFSATVFIRLDLSHMGFGDTDSASLTAYYYQDKDTAAEAEDLGSLDWEVRYFRLD